MLQSADWLKSLQFLSEAAQKTVHPVNLVKYEL
jgi:hypothetical protein